MFERYAIHQILFLFTFKSTYQYLGINTNVLGFGGSFPLAQLCDVAYIQYISYCIYECNIYKPLAAFCRELNSLDSYMEASSARHKDC